jgi:diguanylate cyclase (GGDEF)-like protein
VPIRGALARWGGEEFVMAYHASSDLEASAFADELRQRVEHTSVQLDTGTQVEVTVSIGVAEHLPSESLESLVERADHAMYAAKVGGRNRVELAQRVVRSPPVPVSLRVPA